MKKLFQLSLIAFLLLFIGCASQKTPFYKLTERSSGLVDVDLDDNGYLDQAYGGTNASGSANARAALGLAIGSDVQAWDSDLDTYATITPSADVQSFLSSADYTAMKTALGAEPADATIIKQVDVDNVPVDSATTVPVSSGWAFAHVAAADPHTGYMLESNIGTGANNYVQLTAAGFLPALDGSLLTNLGGGLSVDDTPENADTTDAISSNWAYDLTHWQDMTNLQVIGMRATFKAGEDFYIGDFPSAYYLKNSVDGPRVFRYRAGSASADNDVYAPLGIITYDSLTTTGPDTGENIIVTAPGQPWCFANTAEDMTSGQVGTPYYLGISGWWLDNASTLTTAGDHIIPFGVIVDYDIETVCYNPNSFDVTVAP